MKTFKSLVYWVLFLGTMTSDGAGASKFEQSGAGTELLTKPGATLVTSNGGTYANDPDASVLQREKISRAPLLIAYDETVLARKRRLDVPMLAERLEDKTTEPGQLLGKTDREIVTVLGNPVSIAKAPPAEIWNYMIRSCHLSLYFYPDITSDTRRALTYKVAPNGRGVAACEFILNNEFHRNGD